MRMTNVVLIHFMKGKKKKECLGKHGALPRFVSCRPERSSHLKYYISCVFVRKCFFLIIRFSHTHYLEHYVVAQNIVLRGM
jgi:hypothetical protein